MQAGETAERTREYDDTLLAIVGVLDRGEEAGERRGIGEIRGALEVGRALLGWGLGR